MTIKPSSGRWDVLDISRPLFYKIQDFVKLCREQVQSSEDAAVGSQIVPAKVERRALTDGG